MRSVVELLGLAIVLFVTTNVDDLVVLVGFFAHPAFRARDVVAGQFAGVAVLFIVSAAAALFSLVIPKAYLGLLGIFPILIGIRKLLGLRRNRGRATQTKAPGTPTGGYGNIAGVALVTVANGGDNIGVYTPSFALHSGNQVVIIGLVFVVMTALWCVLAHWMANHPTFGALLRRYAPVIVPLVFIALGILILLDAGSIPSLPGFIFRQHSLVRRTSQATATLLAL